AAPGAVPTFIVLNADDAYGAEVPEWAKGFPRPQLFQGPSGWTRKNPPNTVERSCALLGTTPDALRIAALVKAIASQPENVALVGKGEAGIIAAYAALLSGSKV